MNNFRNLDVWDKAVDLATYIYEMTEEFPTAEKYGLTSQMRRSAVSISSNIAEGAGRGSKKEFNQFLNISMGSCYELETQLTISQNLSFLNDADYDDIKEKLIEIQKMLYAFKRSLEVK